MFGRKKEKPLPSYSRSYWFISFAFDAPNNGGQLFGNTVTPLRPFDWLQEENKKEALKIKLINFWQIDRTRYDTLKEKIG